MAGTASTAITRRRAFLVRDMTPPFGGPHRGGRCGVRRQWGAARDPCDRHRGGRTGALEGGSKQLPTRRLANTPASSCKKQATLFKESACCAVFALIDERSRCP